jgi:hypothetical protein
MTAAGRAAVSLHLGVHSGVGVGLERGLCGNSRRGRWRCQRFVLLAYTGQSGHRRPKHHDAALKIQRRRLYDFLTDPVFG